MPPRGGYGDNEPMAWFEVLIPNTSVADVYEEGLMNSLARAILASGVPAEAVHVFRGRTENMDRVFYIQIPGGHVSEAIAYSLEHFSAQICEAPKTDYLTKLEIP